MPCVCAAGEATCPSARQCSAPALPAPCSLLNLPQEELAYSSDVCPQQARSSDAVRLQGGGPHPAPLCRAARGDVHPHAASRAAAAAGRPPGGCCGLCMHVQTASS